MNTLYRKVVSLRGKVSYLPHEEEPVTAIEMSDAEMLTVAGALGVTLLTIYERCLPPHKRNARKVKNVEIAILELYHGAGAKIDPNMSQWFCEAWDRTMRSMSAERR